MMEPLILANPTVSVMMPCYNARESLPWALASLLAQTFEDWELVLVDDGSTDHPEEVVEQANDPRIRLIRLPENRGRGHARQVALDNARGEYIAMLDADDWMYPERLNIEVRALRAHPGVTLVSSGMAIVNEQNELVGVRGTGDGTVKGPHEGLRIPVTHAPSMYRSAHIGDVGFNDALRRIEDTDFVVRLLRDRCHLVLPSVLYVYTEDTKGAARNAADALHYGRKRILEESRRKPSLSLVRAWSHSMARELVYRAADRVGKGRWLIRRRSQQPSPDEMRQFAEAARIVGGYIPLGRGVPESPAHGSIEGRRF